MPPAQVVLSLFGIVIVIAGAYYATYYISIKASGQTRGKARGRNRRINLLERFAISKDKSFCIVEIAGKIYIVGVTNQSMTLLDTLDPGELEESETEGAAAAAAWGAAPGGPFSGKIVNRLSAYMSRKLDKKKRTGDNAGLKGKSFEESMRSAREKKASGHPGSVEAKQSSDSEEDKWAR